MEKKIIIDGVDVDFGVFEDGTLTLDNGFDVIQFNKPEAIALRDFLIQLDLGV